MLKDIKAHIDSNTVVVWDFNTPLSPIDRWSKQKNQQRNPQTKWYHGSNGPDWSIQNISSNNSTKYVLLSIPWNFLQNWSYLKHKASPSKYKKIEVTPCILSYQNALKQELDSKNNSRKYVNNWRLNNKLFNNQWVK
jgi:hypothetical protein